MNLHRFVVHVMLKAGVLDPQGQAVADVMRQSGFPVQGVRVGRRIEVEVSAPSSQEAEALVRQMSHDLLANPVLEQFEVESLS
jgi:phosphoribosylformylglycinamidine synthase PurS subunit